ncbi:MAG TPA: ion channel [Pseudomonadales bacterium]|nr:ion channel [Pseudomonadales bacterium]
MHVPILIGDDHVNLFSLQIPLPFPRAYQVLFIALLGLLLVYPLVAEAPLLSGLTQFFVGAVLLAAALAASSDGRQFRITMVFAAFGLLFGVFGELVAPVAVGASRIYGLVFLGWVTWQVLHDVLLVGRRVNAHIIYGALCAYLLIGLVFAFAFSALHSFVPESLAGIESGGERHAPFTEFAYFSFASLTTLGIGDVLPLSSLARALTYVEAVIGQIYLTVIVARLVALYSAAALRESGD